MIKYMTFFLIRIFLFAIGCSIALFAVLPLGIITYLVGKVAPLSRTADFMIGLVVTGLLIVDWFIPLN